MAYASVGLRNDVIAYLNGLPQGILAEMCQDVVAFLQSDCGFLPFYEHRRYMPEHGEMTDSDGLKALTFLFKSAAKRGVSVEELVSELKASMQWSDSSLAVIRHIWKEQGAALCSRQAEETLLVGQLVSMEWQLGMAMSSSFCRSLNSPYLTLRLNMADPSGTLLQKTVQMSVAEFQNFAAQLKDMASALETAA